MKYTTSILALCALAPTLITAAPAPQNLATSGAQNPQCKIVFNDRMCKDHDKDKQFEFHVRVTDGLSYTPHPSIPQNVQQVSHCYDFVDQSNNDPKLDKKAEAEYGVHGRTIIETDKRPIFTFQPGMGHMWMTDDSCKQNFKAVAVFEKTGCRGDYMWYNLPMMHDTKEASFEHDNNDWCVAPFKPIFNKAIGSFQMWAMPPTDEAFKLGAVTDE